MLLKLEGELCEGSARTKEAPTHEISILNVLKA